MSALWLRVVICAVLLGVPVYAMAEMPGKADQEADEEMAAELIGAPVFARDGREVGEVADVAFDEEGQPLRMRMRTGAALGFGPRLVEIGKGGFVTLRGAVVLDLPQDAVLTLPELTDDADQK